MKKVIKIVIGFITFTFLVSIVLFVISPIFVPKWLHNDNNMMTSIVKGFYEEPKDSLDVVYLGNSSIYRGISPITIWDDYGITGYVFSTPEQVSWFSYYSLLEILKYQSPSVIFYDVSPSLHNSHSHESNYRKAFDNMKLSINKLNAINDKSFEFSFFDKLSYIFPVLKYHSRINELTTEDFILPYEHSRFAYKGLDLTIEINKYSTEENYMSRSDVEYYGMSEKSKMYLDMMVDECKKRNIDLVLIRIPEIEWSNYASKIYTEYAEENNIKFIDFNLLLDELGFDWEHDTSDGGYHLNLYGAEKISKYIGKYLNDTYYFINKKDVPEFEYWNIDSQKFHDDISKLYNVNK